VNIQCLSSVTQLSKVVTLHWYNGKHGHVHREASTLAICYDNGRMQIMRDESDDSKCLSSSNNHFVIVLVIVLVLGSLLMFSERTLK
jgi:hypothetical protein